MSEKSNTIKDNFEFAGQTHYIEYQESDSFEHLPQDEIRQIYGICLTDGKVSIVKYAQDKPNLPGGKVEEGEGWEGAFRREVEEEINARVLSIHPIGYQYPLDTDKHRKYELRVVADIEFSGEFTPDPAGTVIGYDLVELREVNGYIQYDSVGERMVEQAKDIIDNNLL